MSGTTCPWGQPRPPRARGPGSPPAACTMAKSITLLSPKPAPRHRDLLPPHKTPRDPSCPQVTSLQQRMREAGEGAAWGGSGARWCPGRSPSPWYLLQVLAQETQLGFAVHRRQLRLEPAADALRLHPRRVVLEELVLGLLVLHPLFAACRQGPVSRRGCATPLPQPPAPAALTLGPPTGWAALLLLLSCS